MAITRDEIISVLGTVDETLVAEIAATDATGAELREAAAWLSADERWSIRAGRSRVHGWQP